MKEITTSLRLFVDFDGTVTKYDVGDTIFTKFMTCEPAVHDKLIADWKAGIISSEQCLTRESEQTHVSEHELCTVLDEFELTPGFAETAKFCEQNDVPLAILSDGMDYYIEYILKRHGLSSVPFKSNHMYFHNGGMVVDFPFIEKGCGRCGNCKRWHMDAIREDGEKIVYVGDGYSDRFAIQSADIVFAKSDLAEYCTKTNHSFTPFDDFYTILDYLKNDSLSAGSSV